MLKHTLNTVI